MAVSAGHPYEALALKAVDDSGTRRARFGRVIRCAILATLIAGATFPATAAPTRRVLLLSADPHTSPGLLEVELSLRRVFSDSLQGGAELDVEHLDMVYGTSPELRQLLVDLLKAKCAERPPAVVIAVGAGPLRFALDERQQLFPNARILFCHIPRDDLGAIAPPKDVCGILSNWGFGEELGVALRLLPDTRQAVVILGNGPVEQRYEPTWRREFARYGNRVKIDWWVGVPLSELEMRIAHLPARTVVIYIAVYRDSAGGNYVPVLVLEKLARRSSAPIFGVGTHYVGLGVVGDGRYNYKELGTQLGERTVRLLQGEPPERIGITVNRPATPTFDGRELRRWNIPRDRLPAGSRILFEQRSLWEQHRWTVLFALAVIFLQAILLGWVLAQRIARRRAERGEDQSQRLHQSVVDSLDERIATLARDGSIVAANRAWREFAESHGSGAALGVGNNYLQFVRHAVERGQQDARRTMESLEAVLTERETALALEYSSPGEDEGCRYEMRIVSLRRPDGGAIVVIQDVTDRWRSVGRVRIALESLPVATFLVDDEGRIELVNAEAERLFGHRRDELLGEFVSVVIPPSSLRLHTPRRNADAHVVERNVTGRRKDGSEVFVELHLRSIVMGGRRMMLVSILDLSERRRMDAEVQRLREETAHFGRVAAVGEMSAAIAHELNQPLTGILTNSQAAQRFVAGGSFTPEDLSETLADIVADTRRAGEVIQRLRMMLRKGPLETRALDVNEMVQQVVRLVSHDLSLRSAVLDLELTENLPAVAGDRIHLQQVILNLILNGADAMIDLPPERRRMLLRTAPGIERTVRIELRDSGPGIPAEAMPHIFEPFFTTKKTGMGMGLSIVRSIVETHDGQITCANAASGGAVFTVVLPATNEGEAA